MVTRRVRGGWTLPELLAVLAIAAILLQAAAPSFSMLAERTRVARWARLVVADLHDARAQAVARGATVQLSLDPGRATGCVVIHAVADGPCLCDANGAALCTSGRPAIRVRTPAEQDGIRIAANIRQIVFDPLHGTATPTGTLRISAPGGHAVHHSVNLMGRVRSCSPAGLVRGYPAC